MPKLKNHQSMHDLACMIKVKTIILRLEDQGSKVNQTNLTLNNKSQRRLSKECCVFYSTK